MKPAGYPFPALVGLDSMKLALELAAIDLRLSVLIRGDKGAGKSTAARGLADLLEPGAPFVNLPIGATEDRLLGGLDIEKALRGESALKPGLLADAHGGVLYVDEVNLLPDHLADALLDAVASGIHVVEREGFSATQSAQFVMVGSMNPEEGALRPQILDRFALAVDVAASMEASVRRTVIERRLSFDADADAFASEWNGDQRRLAARLAQARRRLPAVVVPDAILDLITRRVVEHEVRSLRADLAVVRGSRALAALEGVPAVTTEQVEAVLPLALSHRTHARQRPPRSTPSSAPSPPESLESDPGQSEARGGRAPGDVGTGRAIGAERVFQPVDLPAPRMEVEQSTLKAGASSRSSTANRGAVIGARQSTDPRELDPRATLLHAIARPGGGPIVSEDLHERRRAPVAGTRYVFVVDSSGSHAAQERMRLVKGAVNGLLEGTHGRHDEVVVISCRGAAAAVLIEPTTILAEAMRALESMPTGGRTPLAHALELAAAYVTDAAVVIVVTDGHANVASRTDDPWVDTLDAAGAIACPALVVDSEDPRQPTGKPRELATAMRAAHLRLGDLDQASVLRIVRETEPAVRHGVD